MNIRIVNWTPSRRSRTIEVFLKRPAFDPEAEQVAAVVEAADLAPPVAEQA